MCEIAEWLDWVRQWSARRYIRYTRRSRVLVCCRGTRSHFEVAYDGVARLARPHMRTCICVFSSRRACAVSAFFTFGPLGPHTRLCARKGPFPRSFSSLPIFFIFFYATIPQKFQERTARASSMSAPHTSYLIRHIKRARRAPPPLPRAPHQATQAHHPHRLSRPFLAPLALSSISVFLLLNVTQLPLLSLPYASLSRSILP